MQSMRILFYPYNFFKKCPLAMLTNFVLPPPLTFDDVARKMSLPRDNDFFPITSAKSQQMSRTKSSTLQWSIFKKKNCRSKTKLS
jgi:hypothetical protein